MTFGEIQGIIVYELFFADCKITYRGTGIQVKCAPVAEETSSDTKNCAEISSHNFAYLLNLVRVTNLEVQANDIKVQLSGMEGEIKDGLKKIGNDEDSREFKINALCLLAGRKAYGWLGYDLCEEEGFDSSQDVGPSGGEPFQKGGYERNKWTSTVTKAGTDSTRIGKSLLRSMGECNTKVCSEACNMIKTQIDRVKATIFEIQSKMNKLEDRFQTDITKLCYQSSKSHMKVKFLCKFADLFNKISYDLCEEGFNPYQIIDPEYQPEYQPFNDGIQKIRKTGRQNDNGYCSSTGTKSITDAKIVIEEFPWHAVDCNVNVCSGEVPTLIKTNIVKLSDTISNILSQLKKMRGSFQDKMSNIENEFNFPDLDFKITALCKLGNLFNDPTYEMCENGFSEFHFLEPTGSGTGTSTGTGTGTGLSTGTGYGVWTGSGTGSGYGYEEAEGSGVGSGTGTGTGSGSSTGTGQTGPTEKPCELNEIPETGNKPCTLLVEFSISLHLFFT